VSLPLIVLGAGGHAAVLIDALQRCGAEILGIAGPGLAAGSKGPLGVPILGGDDDVLERDPGSIRLVNGLGSTRLPEARQSLYQRFKAGGYSFETVVHPSAVVARDVILGEGTQVMAGAVIQTGTILGANVIVNTRVSVDHDCRIGDGVHLAPGVTLSGLVTIGRASHLGTGSVVIHQITIGAGCLIAAGATVYRDLPDGQELVTR